jgi:hypothetical protein
MLSRGGEEAAPELGNGQRAAAVEPPAGASLENEDGPDRLRSVDLGAGPSNGLGPSTFFFLG